MADAPAPSHAGWVADQGASSGPEGAARQRDDRERDPGRKGRRRARRRADGTRRRTRWGRVLLSVAVLVAVGLALAAGLLLTSMRSPMAVEAVVVEGSGPALHPQIRSAIGGAVGAPFSSVDVAAASKRMGAIDGIESAQLHWTWWNTLTVSVTELTPVAVIQGPGGTFLVVDAEGRTVRTVPERPEGLVLVSAGGPAGKVAALQVAERIPADLVGSVEAVTTANTGAVRLKMTNGVTVTLGAPSDIDAKLALAQQLLATGAKQINVTVPERPALKGLP